MHIVLDSFPRRLGRCLEERSHVNVETAIGVSRCHDFCSAVVPVLPHFCDKDARTTSFLLCKLFCQLTGFLKVGVVFAF